MRILYGHFVKLLELETMCFYIYEICDLILFITQVYGWNIKTISNFRSLSDHMGNDKPHPESTE